jgi:hypothetical protein
MIFKRKKCDASPLVIDDEFEVINEEDLAKYVGDIVLGHYAHVKRIIKSLSSSPSSVSDNSIDSAIKYLTASTIEKRDGWLFQIISWILLLTENTSKKYYCQQPHDAPAQHGLDGIAVILNDTLQIENIIIVEDKCTPNQRAIFSGVWSEFKDFENRRFDNKIVSRISSMLENVNDGDVLEANKNDIYAQSLWSYRVCINRDSRYEGVEKRKKLFKGYDGCIINNTPHRRFAATIYKDNIRVWMNNFSAKVIEYLESLKIETTEGTV